MIISINTYPQLFDTIIHRLRLNLCLAAQAHRQGANQTLMRGYFDHSLARLSQMYRTGIYDNLSVEAIFSSAIHTETLISHEYKRELKRISDLGHDISSEAPGPAVHRNRARALISACRNARNLNMSPAIHHIWCVCATLFAATGRFYREPRLCSFARQ